MTRALAVLIALTAAACLAAKPKTDTSAYPDDDYGSIVERFSIEQALESIGFVEDALSSFMALTESASGLMSAQQLASFGCTDWETQNLGFYNHVASIRGALLYADYRIAELELEQARQCYDDGETGLSELGAAEDAYTVAYTVYIDFVQSAGVAD
ncbi:hypothetical protein JW921_11655 [Candidatus Fermentibacterales bacterium]|nr:hypothetical protein [Candidatus Fermentibacterales bacterium]